MNTPDVRGGLRRSVRERVGAAIGGGREEPDAAAYPRTAAWPGSPGAGPAPGKARKLEAPLADPLTWHAVDAAVRWAGSGAAWPYAVLLGPEEATVRLAGRVPVVAPEPWRTVEGGWAAPREALSAGDPPTHLGRAYSSTAYAALGSSGADLVFLDLALVPGVLTVQGDQRAAGELISSLLAQLAAGGAHRVIAAERSPRALEEIEHQETAPPTFLAWSNPDAPTATRLHRATTLRPWLRVVVLGDTNGTRWSLTVGADGVVSSAALGLTAASAGLPPQIPPRPAPAAVPEPTIVAPVGPPPSLDEHPGLLPLPPREAGLSAEPFAPSQLVGGRH